MKLRLKSAVLAFTVPPHHKLGLSKPVRIFLSARRLILRDFNGIEVVLWLMLNKTSTVKIWDVPIFSSSGPSHPQVSHEHPTDCPSGTASGPSGWFVPDDSIASGHNMAAYQLNNGPCQLSLAPCRKTLHIFIDTSLTLFKLSPLLSVLTALSFFPSRLDFLTIACGWLTSYGV